MQIDCRCWKCIHFNNGVDWECKAFPKGIPMDIVNGLILHEDIIEGQVGDYLFEDVLGKKRKIIRAKR